MLRREAPHGGIEGEDRLRLRSRPGRLTRLGEEIDLGNSGVDRARDRHLPPPTIQQVEKIKNLQLGRHDVSADAGK